MELEGEKIKFIDPATVPIFVLIFLYIIVGIVFWVVMQKMSTWVLV